MSRRHRFVLERIVDNIVVESLRPRQPRRQGAMQDARFHAMKLRPARQIGGKPDRVRVRNLTTDMVVVTYERRGGRVVKV